MSGFQLVVLQGRDAGKVFPLEGATVALGRPGGEAQVQFEEPSVSRLHAVLTWSEEAGVYLLSNRSFTSPARVDGQPASSTPLAVGCRIQLGALVAELQPASTQAEIMGFMEVLGSGEGEPLRVALHARRTVFGRHDGCDIVLEDPTTSALHAVVEWFDRIPALYPASDGSARTLVNGIPLPRGGVSLSPRDRILMGQGTLLRWLPVEALAEPVPEAPPTPKGPPRVPAGLRLADRLRPVPLRARAAFLRDLAGRLDAGEPITRAVEAAPLPRLGRHLAAQVESGQTLAEAAERFPGTFDGFSCALLASGEAAGRLGAHLRELAATLEFRAGLAEQVRAAVRGPLAVTGALVLAAVFGGMLMARGPLAAGGAVLGTALTAVVMGVLAGMMLRARAERWVRRCPRLDEGLRDRAGALFMRTLAGMLEAGLPASRAAALAARNCGSPVTGAPLAEAARRVAGGQPVAEAVRRAALFGGRVEDLLSRGEEEGRLPAALTEAAEVLEGRAEGSLHQALPSLGRKVLLAGALLLLAAGGASSLVALGMSG